MKGAFVTDTAAMCVFDIASLKHRLADDADWWCTPDAEPEEVNRANVAFIGLGSHGRYAFTLVDEMSDPQAEWNLYLPSGRIFRGAAEEVTPDGLEPEAVRGGTFMNLPAGRYRLCVSRNGNEIAIALYLAPDSTTNALSSPIRI